MRLSKVGKRFASGSGIGQLMDDLGAALASGGEMLMLGGGNPAHIPAVQERFRRATQDLLADGARFARAIGDYDGPRGNAEFIEALAGLLAREVGWDVGPQNIALTMGSQSAFFALFNMFAGAMDDGTTRRVLLPLAPEYIGYADVGLEEGLFVSAKPRIEYLEDRLFKYHVDFDALPLGDDIGAICVSRPTNPTGNVLTDDEIERLAGLARDRDIPLIIDNAYGTPFPNIIFTAATPIWNEQTIVCMSLSKLGLPTTRTGIVVARAEVIEAISNMNAVLSLAPVGLGAALALDLVRSGEIIAMSRDVIRPFYQAKAERAVAQLRDELEGVDFQIHRPEGALFLWVWFRDLPITSQDLYERLKQRGTLVLPGHYFFPGLDEPWPHKDECIRVTYSQDDAVVSEGLHRIAQEAKRAYAGGAS
jgi:valine--pyruvate aminotransferase